MKNYRFITPKRTGKWYPDLETAQRHACEIGAGYLDTRTGQFVAYVGTVLETIIRSGKSSPAAA
ncbi:hypothetical protein [Novosphingobium beihaiensis]|uniref:Uncharacterized protein n=1 Tax=Novosphingobium beihaiensis TaxID=2930389 RepID=A0ABT0BQR2_9SPHN|nr:hypothetical protein [Novosphingobium beihaiensis]MCJ2187393.1 hypothetical protein [Novosphingobium beihaiensis]